MGQKLYLYEVLYYTRPTNVEKYCIITEDDGRCAIDIARSLRQEVEDWVPQEPPYNTSVKKILRHEIEMRGPIGAFEQMRFKTIPMSTEELFSDEYKPWTDRDDTKDPHPIA